MLKLLKEYPTLIPAAFRRFPLAIAFAFLTSVAFIFCVDGLPKVFPTRTTFSRILDIWLLIYPVAAMLIALATSLIQESRKSTRKMPQILTSVSWLVISVTLSLCFISADNWGDKESIGHITICIYSLIGIALIYGPFWNQKNDNALWTFGNKISDPIFTSYLITIFFSIASFALLAAINAISNNTDSSSAPFGLVIVFTIFPILCMACIPSIDKCTEETPALENFVTTIKLKIKSRQFSFSFDGIKHIFLPLYTIFIVTVHIYDITALLQWKFPTRTIFFLAVGTLACALIIQNKYYPARIKAEPSSEKKIARILPFTCLIPTITATIAIIQRISEYSITASLYYALGFCIFLCISLILDSIPKTILTKYAIIIFCAINTVTLIGPFSITNVTRYAWLKNIEKTLVSEGYTAYPLSEKDTKKFFSDLWDKDGRKASIVAYQVQALHARSIEKLYQYFPENSDLVDISKKYPTINKTIKNDKIHTMPENFSKSAFVVYTFKHEELVTRNDTLFFDYPLKDIDSTSSKVLRFYVPKQNWHNKDIKILETEGARFEVEDIRFRQWENKKHKRERDLRLVGILFME